MSSTRSGGLAERDQRVGDRCTSLFPRARVCVCVLTPQSIGNALRLDKVTQEQWEVFENGGAARAVEEMLRKLDGRLSLQTRSEQLMTLSH